MVRGRQPAACEEGNAVAGKTISDWRAQRREVELKRGRWQRREEYMHSHHATCRNYAPESGRLLPIGPIKYSPLPPTSSASMIGVTHETRHTETRTHYLHTHSSSEQLQVILQFTRLFPQDPDFAIHVSFPRPWRELAVPSF